jgi:organic radical activating enzyme
MNDTREHWLGKRLMLRWMVTQWCNYSCSYCPQVHSRKQIYKGSPGHWADNRPWEDWFAAFERHLSHRSTSFHMTGGEAMLDRKNMEPLLGALTRASWVSVVDVDSNGTFKPDWDVDVAKINVHLSFHPEHTTLEKYVERLQVYAAAGWKVTNGAFLALPDNFPLMRAYVAALNSLGMPVDVIPKDGSMSSYSKEQAAELEKLIPEGCLYRGGLSPKGKPCLFPALTYEVDPDGSAIVACHRTKGPQYHGSVFGDLPKLFEDYTPCPKVSCPCDDRFVFLKELGVGDNASVKTAYSKRLLELQLCE